MSSGDETSKFGTLVSVPYDTKVYRNVVAGWFWLWWSNVAAVGATVSAALTACAVQTWFVAGKFFASGDVGPYLPLLGDVLRSWTGSLTGAGSSGYQSSNVVPAVVRWVATGVGFSEMFAQRVYFTVVAVVAVVAMAYLAAGWVKSRAAVVVAALMVVFNPFTVTTLPNVLPLTAMGSAALIAGAATRVAVGRRVSPYVYILAAVWVSPVVRNPPLLVLVAGVALGCAVAVIAVGFVTGCRNLRPSLAALLWLSVASLFWVVPVFLHYWNGTEGLAIVAERNADAWSWTHRRSGVWQVLSLTASYFWGDAGVVPATAVLDEQPWRYMRYGIPVLVVLSMLVATRRRLVAVAAAVALVSATISVGLNWPVRPLYQFLFDNVPGFWLFRQPFSKFGVLLILSYAMIVALGVDGLVRRVNDGRWRPVFGVAAGSVGAVAVCAMVAFAHPLYTGSVVPGDRPTLPSAQVAVPADWENAGKWLDVAPNAGSVLVLPLSEYYQRGTTWGYYGVDDLVSRVTSRPALFTLPGGYYEAAGVSEELMRVAEDAVASGDKRAAQGAMRALGVAYLLVRTDVDPSWGFERRFRDGDMLRDRAENMFSSDGGAAFDLLSIFAVSQDVSTDASRVVPVSEGLSEERRADISASLPAGTVAVGESDTGAWAWVPDVRERVGEFANDRGAHYASVVLHGPMLLEAKVVDDDQGWRVELRNLSSMDVDDVQLFDWSRSVVSQERPAALSVAGRTVLLGPDPVRFEADPGALIEVFVETDPVLFTQADVDAVGNCNNPDGVSLETAGISAVLNNTSVVLRAASGAACVAMLAPSPTEVGGERLWVLRGSFERVAGAVTRFCVWLPAEGACVGRASREFASSTGSFDEMIAATDGADTTGAQLFLYADAPQNGAGSAEVTFSDVRMLSLKSAAMIDVRVVPDAPVLLDLAAGSTAALPEPTALDSLLGPFQSTAENCNRYDDRPDAETGVRVSPLDGDLNPFELSAVWHSACVSARLDGAAHLSALTLDFDYRTSSKGTGRWCVQAAGTPGCVASGSLPSTASWKQVTAKFVLEPKTFTEQASGELKLFLYADATGPQDTAPNPTRVAYRQVTVAPTYPVSFVAVPASDKQTVVVLRQSYGNQWQVSGVRSGADHVVVDGWANGWLVRGAAPSSPEFRYGPDLWTQLAAVVLLFAVAAAEVERRLYRRGQI
jgi:arabinofuranan 3-O-arabinosyltransferase